MLATALYDIHRKLGAKIVSFAGYLMPIEYSGITKEHLAVRNSAGLFDVSHMGQFWVRGSGSLEFLQRITTNDVSVLTPGKVQYSCFPNGQGGIVDDLLVYKFDDYKYLLVVNAANIQKDWEWCNQHLTTNVVLENVSNATSLIAIQGKSSTSILQKLTNCDLSTIPYYSFVVTQVCGIDDVIVSNTGYTGAGGFELIVDNQCVAKLWGAIMNEGLEKGIVAAGLGARDSLRIEMGYCLYGNDIDDSTSTIEAGLGWITKFTEDNDFIDRELLLNQKLNGVSKVLKGFVMTEKAIPRKDYEITDISGAVIGKVTSGTMSPILNKGIGLGYINSDYLKNNSSLFIKIRNRLVKAEITKTPFIK
jgi:aminomethyltransferase